jgi:hypothetical protein
MRRVFSVLLFLTAGLILLTGIALSQSEKLRPLHIATGGLQQTITANSTDQADLQRVGYILEDRGGVFRAGDRRERSYTFRGPSGSSAVLLDNENPRLVAIRRELVFDITFAVKEGRSPADMLAVAPKLIAAMRKALSQDPAVVAGLGYLATAAGSGVTPEALQTAVIDYMQRYQQPSTPIQAACTSCGSRDGFGDEYNGGPGMYATLNVGGSDWKIAGIRHYLDGDSTFRVQVTANIPRSEP